MMKTLFIVVSGDVSRLQAADVDFLGGAFGFLTEGGPGGSPLTYESLSWTLPVEHMWPMDSWWDYHCANPQVADTW